MEKNKDVNLSEMDASFVISSFKNKERRNNPSSIPRPLLPPWEQAEGGKSKEDVPDTATLSNTSDEGIVGNADDESDSPDKGNISDASNTADDAIGSIGNAKRTTSRQRKAAFEEYRELFLQTPKIINRKPVFISESTRDRLNKVARKLGDDNMSASGFLENLALYHLSMYEEDIEAWRKL
ncbi:MAG: DUF3408 domain-containing protein [Tannerella sp.]|jgi:hypothetical protein|nr:DUF3408 domain-containing protein [Tannerella sp.]